MMKSEVCFFSDLQIYASEHLIITFLFAKHMLRKVDYQFIKGLMTLLHAIENQYLICYVRRSGIRMLITKTCLHNFDPLKPHFYIVKLGFTGVYNIFLISAQKHRLWYSLEPPRRGGSNEYPQSMFWAEIGKISEFFIWKFSVFGDEIFYIFE